VGTGRGRLVPLIEGQLREFSTDRTQVAESPFTLAPGRWSWSVDAAGASHGSIDSLSQTSAEFSRVSVAAGLPHRFELAEVASGWSRERLTSTGSIPDETRQGLGTFTTQLRVTLAGVDSTGAGVGALFSVSVPAASNSPESRAVEASVGVPVAVMMGDALSLNASSQAVLAADAEDTGHHLDWVNAVCVRRDFGATFGTFVELVSVSSGEANRPWLGAIDGGLGWEPRAHFALTGGVCAGHGAGRFDAGVFGAVEIHG
jgi:hypothetical protein